MSNKRYLEIDSTYRNRTQFPRPSNFEVLISQSGTRSAARAFDPVSNAAPIKTWIPDELVLSSLPAPGPNIVSSATNTAGEFVVSVNINEASKIPNYYSGYPITIGGDTVKILTWTYMSSNTTLDYFTITVLPVLSSATGAGLITFAPATGVTDFVAGNIFIPDGFNADHYYVDCILYNETISTSSTGATQNNWRTIISYDGTNKLAGIDLSEGLVDPAVPPGDTWSITDTYTIRKIPPVYVGTLPVTVLPQPSNTRMSFTVPSDTIVRVGDFIRFTGTTLSDVTCRVVSYTGDGTPSNIVTVNCVLDSIPVNPQTFEVLQFSYDNAVPFCYSGSLVSQQEMVCYEIELINLVLPNILLQSGGRTAFYPYVYVELQNISSASAGTKCVIYSNNPNSTRMLFRAAIDDIPNPEVSPFIKIDGDGMVQTVKFKPNDNFKFGVYLPNGDSLQTVDEDNFTPSSPNPLVQISAIFSLKRL